MLRGQGLGTRTNNFGHYSSSRPRKQRELRVGAKLDSDSRVKGDPFRELVGATRRHPLRAACRKRKKGASNGLETACTCRLDLEAGRPLPTGRGPGASRAGALRRSRLGPARCRFARRCRPEDRPVAAALELFASVALLFWYVRPLFLSARDWRPRQDAITPRVITADGARRRVANLAVTRGNASLSARTLR